MSGRKVATMSYQERFVEAYKLADRPPRKELAKAVGVSVQAIGRLLTSTTKTLLTEQSARAADFLQVDHFWLATGEGKPRPDRAWPYEHFSPEQYRRFLTPDERKENEALLWGKIMMAEKKNGTNK